MILTVDILNDFTEELDQLRSSCFPTISPDSTRDIFDERSLHLRIKHGERVAAYGRLTPGPNSVFETWTDGNAELPTGNNIIDLGRCLVHPDYRGLNLIDTLCFESCIWSSRKGFFKLSGTVVPNRFLECRLLSLCFQRSGPIVELHAPDRPRVLVQPLVADLDALSCDHYEKKMQGIIASLRKRGIRLSRLQVKR